MKDIEVVKLEKFLESHKEVFIHEDSEIGLTGGRLFFIVESEQTGEFAKKARQVFTKELLATYNNFSEIRDTKSHLQAAIKKANESLLAFFEENDMPGHEGLMACFVSIEKNKLYYYQIGTQPFIIWRDNVVYHYGTKQDRESQNDDASLSLRETMRLPLSSSTDTVFEIQEVTIKNNDVILIASSDLTIAFSSTEQVTNLLEDRSLQEIRDEVKRAIESLKSQTASGMLCIKTNDIEIEQAPIRKKSSAQFTLPDFKKFAPIDNKKLLLAIPLALIGLIVFVFIVNLIMDIGNKDNGYPPEESSVAIQQNIKINQPAGEMIWEFNAPDEISSSPVVDDGIVYFGCKDNYLYAMDAKTGEIRWRQKTGDGIGSSPTVNDSLVFIGSYDFHLYAFNKKDGHMIWRFRTEGKIISAPTVAGDKIVVGSNDYWLYSIFISSGDLAWKIKTQNIVWTKPLVNDNKIYFTSVDGYLYCCTFDGQPVWRNDIGHGTYGLYSSPAIEGTTIYLGSKDGSLYAVNSVMGDKIWQFSTEGVVRSSPAASNGKIFVGSEDGNIYALSQTGALLWKFPTGNDVNSSPFVSNGIVYCGSDDNIVYAIEISSGAKRWSHDMGSSVYSSPYVKDGILYVGSKKGTFRAISTGGF